MILLYNTELCDAANAPPPRPSKLLPSSVSRYSVLFCFPTRLFCSAVRADQAREHRHSARPAAGAPLHRGGLRPEARLPVDHCGDVLQPVLGPLRAGPFLPVGG